MESIGSIYLTWIKIRKLHLQLETHICCSKKYLKWPFYLFWLDIKERGVKASSSSFIFFDVRFLLILFIDVDSFNFWCSLVWKSSHLRIPFYQDGVTEIFCLPPLTACSFLQHNFEANPLTNTAEEESYLMHPAGKESQEWKKNP